MAIRTALNISQKEAIQTPAAAKVLVESMNRQVGEQRAEIVALKLSLTDIQNNLENMRKKFYRADKDRGVLASKLDFFVFLEICKFLSSVVLAGFGFALYPNHSLIGAGLVMIGTLVYIGLTLRERKIRPKARE